MNTSMPGFRSAEIKLPEERVVRNNWVTDVYGKVCGYGDFGPLELASIESQTEACGAFLLTQESDGTPLGLGNASATQHQATQTQLEIVEELAALDSIAEIIPSPLIGRMREALPVLYLAHMAIIDGSILFRTSNHEKNEYEHVLRYIISNKPQLTDTPETSALFSRAHRLNRRLVSAPAFIIQAAQKAQ